MKTSITNRIVKLEERVNGQDEPIIIFIDEVDNKINVTYKNGDIKTFNKQDYKIPFNYNGVLIINDIPKPKVKGKLEERLNND